jgi:hypothetical protein
VSEKSGAVHLLHAARILFIDLRPIEKADSATLDNVVSALIVFVLRHAEPLARCPCNGAIRKSFRHGRGDTRDACGAPMHGA